MLIRQAQTADFDAIWAILSGILAAGETYALPRDMEAEAARQFWMLAPRKTLVAEDAGRILGSYFLKTNQQGPGSHVCNCGYIVAPAARGQGLAAAMCEHSQALARTLGYRAMQFNCVVSTNEAAVQLWSRLGFETVGRLPRAFEHPRAGFIDALVMYKWLGD